MHGLRISGFYKPERFNIGIMAQLFSRQKVNAGRQIEWDFAKVFAIGVKRKFT